MASEDIGDVEVAVVFAPDDGAMPVTNATALTVVKVNNVCLPGASNDGLVVLRGTSVAFDMDVEPATAKCLLSTIYKVRRLRGNGTYEDWYYAAGNYNGTAAVYNPTEGGIYQVQAFVGIGWGGTDERYYVWEDDEIQSVGCKKRGDAMMFGVCDNLWQVRLRNRALSSLGDTAYAFEDELEGRYGFSGLDGDTDKCNYFVAYCIREEGLSLNSQHGHFLYSSYPPIANDWAYETAINRWIYLGFGSQVLVQPGYVVGHPAQPHGHCGIVDFDGWVISAGAQQVNRKYPYWLDGTTGYNKYGEIDE